MSGIRFIVTDAHAEPYAMAPTLMLRLRAEAGDGPVHAAIVRADLHIDAGARTYSVVEGERLVELFGTRDRWAETVRPLFWTQISFALPAFSGSREIDVPLACTYDFDVASAKYFHALEDGRIPLRLLFSGSVFTAVHGAFQVRPIPWDTEASFRLPVATWRDVMDRHFHDTTWIRLRRESFDALYRFRTDRALPSWDAVIEALCEETRPREAV
jgi:hypothetical protein